MIANNSLRFPCIIATSYANLYWICSSINEAIEGTDTEVETKKSNKKQRQRRNSSIASFNPNWMMKQSTVENAISHKLLETAVILSSSELAGNYGVDIRAVDCGGTGVEEVEYDQEEKWENWRQAGAKLCQAQAHVALPAESELMLFFMEVPSILLKLF